MTPQEFKAWFEGFTEAFDRLPTKAQWARVKERVAEIDGKPITERIYLDRYWPTYYPPYRYWSAINGGIGMASNVSNLNATGASYNALSQSGAASSNNYDSWQAMLALGRADAQALAS